MSRCVLLKMMPGGNRVRVLVFGERWWNRYERFRIRYVPVYRVEMILDAFKARIAKWLKEVGA